MSTMMGNDEAFFAKLREKDERQQGIPNIEMNIPLVSNTYKGTLGLELELEGNAPFPTEGYLEHIKGNKTGAMWRAVDDGSLRGYSKEYVLSQPCDVEELDPLIKELFKTLSDRRVTIENSNRCSTHVHVNLNGYKVNHLTSILALWATFEDALISWCGELRKTNHFCLAFKDSPSTIQAWDTFLRTGQAPRGRDIKYASLNILPMFGLGSFEFRCGRAADTPDIPITWAKFIHHFVKYAAERFANPNELAYALSEVGGEEIFREICRRNNLNEFANEVINNAHDFDKSCLVGFRNVQNIVLGYPWEEWMELINKEYVPNPFGGGVKKKKRARVRGIEAGWFVDDDMRVLAVPPINPELDEPRRQREPRYLDARELAPNIDRVNGDTTYVTAQNKIYVWCEFRWVDVQDAREQYPHFFNLNAYNDALLVQLAHE